MHLAWGYLVMLSIINKISHPCHSRQFTKKGSICYESNINMFTYLMSLLINWDDSVHHIVVVPCFAQQCKLICFGFLFIYLAVHIFSPRREIWNRCRIPISASPRGYGRLLMFWSFIWLRKWISDCVPLNWLSWSHPNCRYAALKWISN